MLDIRISYPQFADLDVKLISNYPQIADLDIQIKSLDI